VPPKACVSRKLLRFNMRKLERGKGADASEHARRNESIKTGNKLETLHRHDVCRATELRDKRDSLSICIARMLLPIPITL
jgi:hypothetical protein